MDHWELIDLMNQADAPEAFPRVVIQSEAQLRAELSRFALREPAILALEGPIDQGLQFGLGGPYAGVRWAEHPVSERGGSAIPDRVYCQKRIDFASEEDTIAFWPDELMPTNDAIEIIVYFYNNQRLPDWIAWKEWDPIEHKWTMKPATKAQSA
jgi:hypothetical protein